LAQRGILPPANIQGINAGESARLASWIRRSLSRWFTRCRKLFAATNIIVAVVRSPSRMCNAVDFSQSSLVHFSRAIFARTSSSRISAPPPGIGLQPRVHQPPDRVFDRSARSLPRCTGFPAPKNSADAPGGYRAFSDRSQILVVADLQIRMQAALQQDSRSAQSEHLFDFFS